MIKALFYIIIISQVWLGIGSTFVHLIKQDCEMVELMAEEEKEKEKEIEKEIEKIQDVPEYNLLLSADQERFLALKDYHILTGRPHINNLTQPPETFLL